MKYETKIINGKTWVYDEQCCIDYKYFLQVLAQSYNLQLQVYLALLLIIFCSF